MRFCSLIGILGSKGKRQSETLQRCNSISGGWQSTMGVHAMTVQPNVTTPRVYVTTQSAVVRPHRMGAALDWLAALHETAQVVLPNTRKAGADSSNYVLYITSIDNFVLLSGFTFSASTLNIASSPSINQPLFAWKIDASLRHQNTHIVLKFTIPFSIHHLLQCTS